MIDGPQQTQSRSISSEAPVLGAASRPARPPRTTWTRLSVWLRRWSRETFSRESLLSSLRSLMYVAPLTLLIWMYAEREQLLKVGNVQIRVTLKSSDPNRVVTLMEPADGAVYAELTGPRGRLEAAQEKIDPRMNAAPVQIEVPGDLPPGRYQYQITPNQIGDDPRLSAGGVTVTSVSPRVLDIFVDPLAEIEAPVSAPPDVTNLSEPPVFTPSRVKVTLPQSLLDKARRNSGGQELALYADRTAIARIVTPGPHERVPVKLTAPWGDGKQTLRITPDTVLATLNVKRPDRQLAIRRVPIFQLLAPTTSDDVRVKVQGGDTLSGGVTVIGPDQQVEALDREVQAGLTPVVAYFKVADSEQVGESRTTSLTFDGLPPGVRISADDEKKTITYQLIKRGSAGDL